MSPRRERAIVFALIALHFAIYQTICTIKYQYYLYRDFDLAIFVQAIHGVLHGGWFSSIRGMPWLGDHSSLILIPLAPIFALFPHALTLLAMQSAALALGALPVWHLARRELPAGPLPVMCAALWLLQPALGYLNLFEFHPETLAVPLLVWCALEARAGRAGRAALAGGLALLAREDIVLPVAGLALLAVLERPRRPRIAALLAGLAVASLALSFGVLKPRLLAGQAEYGQMYAQWGATPARAALGMLSHPIEALTGLWSSSDAMDTLRKQQFWLHLFLPVGALSALAPLWLLPAAPVFAEHLLAGRSHQHVIVFQYTALMLPFVVVSAVLGLARAIRRFDASQAKLAGLLLLSLAAATQVLFGPIASFKVWQVRAIAQPNFPDAFERTMKPYRDRMLARVPREGTVVAGFEFLSHLATRRDVQSLHHILAGRYTYSNRPYPLPQHAVALLADLSALIHSFDFGSGARTREVIAAGGLVPVDAVGGTVLLLAGARDSVELYRVGVEWPHPEVLGLVADDQLFFFGAERVDSVVTRGGVLRIAAYWKRVAPANRNYLSQAWLTQGREPVLYGRARSLGYGILPPGDWPQDSVVRETYHLLIPTNLPPGIYRPVFRLISVDADGRQELPIVQVGTVREPMNGVGLGDVTITK